MIINSIKGPGEPKEPESSSRPISPKPPMNPPDLGDEEEEEITEQDGLDRAEQGVKDLGSSMDKWKTGLSLKRSHYGEEEKRKLSVKELHETATTVREGMLALWTDIVNESDYKFKDYLTKNEDQWVRAGAIVSMIVDELEDRLEVEEPVGPDKGIEEVLQKLVKEGKIKFPKKYPINEALKVRELNEISRVVIKEDFYNFINAGNNVLRTLEENGFENQRARKYLEHLVRYNIM